MTSVAAEIGADRGGVRPVAAGDKPAISAMLARAFFEDPVMVFMFPDIEQRRGKLERLFTLLLTVNGALGGSEVTAGGETAAMWRPPGKASISTWDILLHLRSFLGIYGFVAGRVLSLLGAMDKHHPKEPHWYLMVIGTEPQQQGKGFGGIALRHRLAQVDAVHLPAYLEASKIENVPIYAGFGFEPQGDLPIPGGPIIYPMWRPAR